MTREEAKKVLCVIEKRYCTLTPDERQAIAMAIQALSQEPSVTHKSGKWEYVPQDEGWYICSECRCGNDYADNFCPQCGARMVEPRESEE